MFLEPHFKGQRDGWIEVICGSMFSGKTEELIRRLKRARIASQEVRIFKPLTDKRYDEDNVVSHDANIIHAVAVKRSADILNVSEDVEVIGIDEAQFFDGQLPEVCQTLALRGVRVIVAGLDLDYMGAPFGPMPALLAGAEYVTKVHAICVHCGNLAMHSYRLAEGDEQILLGETESYEPRCRTCYSMGNILKLKKKVESTGSSSEKDLFSN